ncbi:MAG: Flp pilus assembly complex ATPase component TadA, partial [Abitibacteriaceae bacterium]|nr:Flp pilus assembly complex ATPase component TadA [Abditibacteriaceae bacterium]
GKRLTVAMANPNDVFALDEIRMKTGLDVRAVLCSPSQIEAFKNGSNGNGNGATAIDGETGDLNEDITEMLDMLKPVEDMTSGKKKKRESESQAAREGAESAKDDADTELMPGDIAGSAQAADEAPIIRIVNTVLMYAIKDGASDIHIEPQRKQVRIRYRIDGVLHEQMKVPQHILAPMVSRIKIMSSMNIAERRIPQDGRIHISMQGKDFDLRVSTLPTAFGEKVVMRILDKASVLIGLDNLGLYPETQAGVLEICHQPNGMFFVCGPTGSGKTTTLYSVMNVINSVEKNLMTVEDPVEYQLPGLSQVHVNRKAGLSFATALRAFLRQDPDIIMVGETRDLETAEIAVQAALTGHFVLSTIHTNDAPSTATRLSDMGVEPFLISASLVGALAQRLARRICSNCKEEYVPSREQLLLFGHDPRQHPDAKFYRGRGCDKCRQTGFKGRMGIFELMRITEEIAEMIVRRAPLAELKEAARASGMHTLQEDGFRKVLDGMTTVEEVRRVVFTGGH